MKRSIFTFMFVTFNILLAACNGTADPTATPDPTNTAVLPIETIPPTDTAPTRTPPPLDTATAPAETPLPATETPAAEATVPPITTLPIPTLDPNGSWSAVNPLYYLLGPTSAPEGWLVEPCEGEAVLLCITDERVKHMTRPSAPPLPPRPSDIWTSLRPIERSPILMIRLHASTLNL
jgi:hypothetical protein